MRIYLLVFLILSGLAAPAAAQAGRADLARFTVLVPKDGMQKQFEDGYKRHLQWHSKNSDPWNWYGWYITSGKRLGYFVDASFGHGWADFDRPVDPAGDRADLTVNVIPYVRPFAQYTSAYLPEMSSEQNPADLGTALQRVFYFDIRPGFDDDFGEFLRNFKKLMPKISAGQSFSWYRTEDGAAGAGQYFLMLPHEKLADYKKTEDLFERVFRLDEKLRRPFRSSVRKVTAETMRYRADLTYLPGENGSR